MPGDSPSNPKSVGNVGAFPFSHSGEMGQKLPFPTLDILAPRCVPFAGRPPDARSAG